MKTLTQLEVTPGMRVLVRSDFNIPLGSDGVVSRNEAGRIERGLATIGYLSERGARVVVVSHIGRDAQESLAPVARYINSETRHSVGFVPELLGSGVEKMIREMGNGSVLLLENLRSEAGEENNDLAFAQKLASYGEVFVNDAFSASHRLHASIIGVPRFLPAYAGLQFAREVENLDCVRTPKKPLFMVIGGFKFETKIPLIERFVGVADTLVVAGALAHPIYKARGFEIGTSVFDAESDVQAIADNPKVLVPEYVVVKNSAGVSEKHISEVSAEDRIVDIAPSAIDFFRAEITTAQTVLWNGPLGFYEEGHDKGTRYFMEVLSESSGDVVAGGGDTVAVIRQYKQEHIFKFISTAGGAMLEYLAKGNIPGVEALG